jgi:hypothetical protein
MISASTRSVIGGAADPLRQITPTLAASRSSHTSAASLRSARDEALLNVGRVGTNIGRWPLQAPTWRCAERSSSSPSRTLKRQHGRSPSPAPPKVCVVSPTRVVLDRLDILGAATFTFDAAGLTRWTDRLERLLPLP